MSSVNFFAFVIFVIVTVEIVSFCPVYGTSDNQVNDDYLESNPGREKRGDRTKRSPGTPTVFTQAEKTGGVALHNKYRSEQGASNMKYMEWHAELARMAQDYAEGCLYEHSSMMNDDCYNITYDRVGENLHFNTVQLALADAVTAWYDEKADYDFTTGTCAENKACGHYTQVVWANTGLVGCGRAFCAELKENNGNVEKNVFFTSCNYGPKGNYNKAKPYTTGNSCATCDANMKKCKDKMCYQDNLDYQRPSDKLKDCSDKSADQNGQSCQPPSDKLKGCSDKSAGHVIRFPGYLLFSVFLVHLVVKKAIHFNIYRKEQYIC